MKFTIEKRDLFTVPKDYFLCHCVSADFALGAGIAKKFAEMGVKEALKRDLGQPHPYQWNGFGDCFLTQESEWRGEYNLVTKDKCWQKPTKETLRQSLEQMYAYSDVNDKIAMPKIGCGLDRLEWQDVEQIIREVFANSNVEILVCDWQ